MTFDYASLRDGPTKRLLARFGAPLKVYRRTEGAYDPATGIASVAESAMTLNGVITDYSARQVDGDRIRAGDKRVLLDPSGVSKFPEVGDYMVIGGSNHMIVATSHVNPAGTVVLLDCTVRRK